MKIVIQRVQSASVAIEDSTVGTIKQGLLLLVGVGPEDTKEDLDYAVRKIINMRIFSDEDGKMNLSVKDIGGQILSISQFTLFADTKKGNRPAFTGAAKPDMASQFYDDFNQSLSSYVPVERGRFGADMQVSLAQLLVDLFCAKFVDRIGYRVCIVTSEICAAAGLVGLAFLPDLLPNPFTGIILSVIIYAVGSGLIEVLCSPIIEACPFKNKEATMSLLHSFYCWGAAATILISSLFFFLFGMNSWKWLAVMWALIPAINIYNFATCPIEHLVSGGNGMGVRQLFRLCPSRQ